MDKFEQWMRVCLLCDLLMAQTRGISFGAAPECEAQQRQAVQQALLTMQSIVSSMQPPVPRPNQPNWAAIYAYLGSLFSENEERSGEALTNVEWHLIGVLVQNVLENTAREDNYKAALQNWKAQVFQAQKQASAASSQLPTLVSPGQVQTQPITYV